MEVLRARDLSRRFGSLVVLDRVSFSAADGPAPPAGPRRAGAASRRRRPGVAGRPPAAREGVGDGGVGGVAQRCTDGSRGRRGDRSRCL